MQDLMHPISTVETSLYDVGCASPLVVRPQLLECIGISSGAVAAGHILPGSRGFLFICISHLHCITSIICKFPGMLSFSQGD